MSACFSCVAIKKRNIVWLLNHQHRQFATTINAFIANEMSSATWCRNVWFRVVLCIVIESWQTECVQSNWVDKIIYGVALKKIVPSSRLPYVRSLLPSLIWLSRSTHMTDNRMQQFNYSSQPCRIRFQAQIARTRNKTERMNESVSGREKAWASPNWQMDFYWISVSSLSIRCAFTATAILIFGIPMVNGMRCSAWHLRFILSDSCRTDHIKCKLKIIQPNSNAIECGMTLVDTTKPDPTPHTQPSSTQHFSILSFRRLRGLLVNSILLHALV